MKILKAKAGDTLLRFAERYQLVLSDINSGGAFLAVPFLVLIYWV